MNNQGSQSTKRCKEEELESTNSKINAVVVKVSSVAYSEIVMKLN